MVDLSSNPYGVGRAVSASGVSLRSLVATLRRRSGVFFGVLAFALAACLAYCLFAPKQFEASARVALRSAPDTALNLDGSQAPRPSSGAMGQAELETMAAVLHSDKLAWRVIRDLRLYSAPAFAADFPVRFRAFDIDNPDPTAQSWLLERFARNLHTGTVPRTLVVEVRFRSHDPALSAAIVNGLIRAYDEQAADAHMHSTAQATGWLNRQLVELKKSVDRDESDLAAFQQEHSLIYAPVTDAQGNSDQIQHSAVVQSIDELGRQVVDASAERMRREAQYLAAAHGDPELILASDTTLSGADGAGSVPLLRQLHAQQSTLEQELAQLSQEHGPNFPRTVEICSQLADLSRQIKLENGRIIQRFRSAMHAAENREGLLRSSLKNATAQGLVQNAAAAQFAVMRQESNSRRSLYVDTLEKARQAGMQAGVAESNLAVIDYARRPLKPVAPNLPVDLAIAFFVGLWLALGAALGIESLKPSAARQALVFFVIAVTAVAAHAQAPTPSTSGLPTGVAHIPQSRDARSTPDPRQAPAVWGAPAAQPGANWASVNLDTVLPAPIAPGDMIEVNEVHEPQAHAVARVAQDGTVTLPLAGVVKLVGLTESDAAHAIERALIARGMLLHPQVTVLVTVSVGQDVSVMGEVARPGVYPYTAHHRLLDFVAAAQGLTPIAGSLVTITPRDPNAAPYAVALSSAEEHNPDLQAGDMVEVHKAGLVYVVGDVMRPGGFPVDPSAKLTVVRALTLAWGPTQNAALSKALLIREQPGGRTLTELNLKRMLRGQDPDLPIQDRDILFVPDSFAKNLMNRTMESVVQSAAGVSIYAGLVYSQRF